MHPLSHGVPDLCRSSCFVSFCCLHMCGDSIAGEPTLLSWLVIIKLCYSNLWLVTSFILPTCFPCFPVCFSAINGSGPAYLSELLHVYTPSRTLCSSSDTRMLEIQQYKRKTHGFRTFSCFGPHIWNSLPQDLRHCSTLSSFKAKLKTFLFSQYFHPN